MLYIPDISKISNAYGYQFTYEITMLKYNFYRGGKLLFWCTQEWMNTWTENELEYALAKNAAEQDGVCLL